MNPVAVLKRQLQKRCLPYYIVDRDPFIFYAYWFDFYGRLEDFTRRFAGKKRVFGVFQFGWHYETEERQARLASVAQLDARKLELAAKQEMLAKAYDRAMERLTSLPDGEYVGLLAGLAAEASSTGREEVILSQKDRARYGKQVVTQANERLGDGHLTLSVQTRPIRGGLILSDGDVEVNCTFETLVRLLRGEMDRTVVEVLFG